MSTPPRNLKSIAMHQRLDQIRLRLLQVHAIDFDADEQSLLQIRETARTLADSDLELYAINVRGILYTIVGRLEESYAIHEEGAQMALEVDNRERWSAAKLNHALILTFRGKYGDARALFESLIPTLESLPDTLENVTRLYLFFTDLGSACMDMGDSEAAIHYASRYVEDWNSQRVLLIQPQRRAEIMCKARDVLSWAYCARGEFADARTQANLLFAISTQQSRAWYVAAGHMALLRIAIFDSAAAADPEIQWDQMSALIAQKANERDSGLWMIEELVLMREARFCKRRDKIQWARRFAEKSLEILATLDNMQRRQIVEAFLADLPPL